MKTETQAKRLRRGAQRGITLCTAAATVLASLMIAPAAIAAPVDLDDPKGPSAAHGQALALEGLGLDLLGAANSTSEFAGQQGGLAGLDLTVLGQELKLGTVTLPLLKDPTDPKSNGLLEIGDASLLRGYSEAKSKAVAQASAGTLNDEGGLNLSDAPNADMNAAKLDLTALLEQLGLAGITNGIINELSLEVGALGAQVAKSDGEIDSSYELAGVKANVGAPLVGDLTTGLSGVVNTVGGLLNGLVGKGGLVDGVLGTLEKVLNINLVVVNLKSEGVRAQVNGLDTLVANVVDELLLTSIKNRSGSVNVDLANGTITLDVAALAIEGNGYTDLNQLPANTSLLNDKTITAITNGVTEALLGDGGADDNSLVGKLTAILTDHLWNSVSIDIFIDAKIRLLSLVPVADTTIQLTGTLAEFAGYDGAKLGNDNVKFDLDLLGFLPLGDLIEPIVKPLLNIVGQSLTGPLLTFVTQDVVAKLQPLVSGLVSGLLSPLLETLEPVLTEVATVTVNEQPKTGDLGAGSHTTNALAVKLLPGVLGANAVSLELGNASVKAADAVAELVASPSTVNAGEKVTLKGSGYTPGETVKIASALGATKSVTVDANGEFTAEWTVPTGTKAGAVTFTATGDTSKRSATASVTVKTSGTGANANANASASAAAAADGQATAAAQAAANPSSNTTTSASAKATANAQAAAKAAATTNASTNASSNADAAAAVSAQAAANSKASSDTNANSTAAANSNASAAAKAAAIANASTNASANASANATGAGAKADANVNASASAAADSNANASAKAAANADASTVASAKATAKAQAAAQSAATANASTKASTKADTSAQAAAQVAAHSKTDSDSKASATAQQSATAQAAAAVAANASSSSDASGTPVPPTAGKCDVTKSRAKSPFVDTATNHKFYPEIDWMHCTKLSTGWKVQKGFEYRPSADMTREAMAAFIFRMQAPKDYKAPKKSLFTDVKTDHRFYREIMWMKESGTSTGYADGTYRPGSKLDRDAMAAFIFRMNAPRNYQPKTQTFVDVDKNTKFYKEIEWMGQEELSKGFWTTAGPEYRPKNGLSREAMAAFIERLVNDYWSSVIPKK